MKAWLTIAEASVIAHRSKRTIRRWITDGRLEVIDGLYGERLVPARAVFELEAATTAYRQNPTRPQPRKHNPM